MTRRGRDGRDDADETPLLTESQAAAELAAAEAQPITIAPPPAPVVDERIRCSHDRDCYLAVNHGGHLVSIPWTVDLPPGARLATAADLTARGA